jgi:hypothetical protein
LHLFSSGGNDLKISIFLRSILTLIAEQAQTAPSLVDKLKTPGGSDRVFYLEEYEMEKSYHDYIVPGKLVSIVL